MKTFTFNKPSMKALRIALPIAFVLLLIASVVLVQTVHLPKKTDGGLKPVSIADYQKSLKAQVDNADGSPTSGRDPSSQSQTTLASAAATPSGTGTRTSTPASALTGSTSAKVAPSQVYSAEQQKTGINDAGCYYDYGVPGQECLAVHVANPDGTVSCDAVRGHGGFPNGIKVSGTDRFHLDTNGDKIACGVGDK